MSDEQRGWKSSQAAARLRDTVTAIARAVVERERPPYRYGTVESVNLDENTCQVVLAGDVESVPIRLYLQRPNVGEVVRVCGMRGDRYVETTVALPEEP